MKKTWLFIKELYSFLFLILLFNSLSAQNPSDYQIIFQKQYKEALEFLSTEKWINDSLIHSGQDADLALAVVFPEILRYSEIRNWAEVKSLEVLYSQYGEKYSDFSVGFFQMKPSFAAKLEKDWNILFTKAQHKRIGISSFDTLNIQSVRYQRTQRLNDIHWAIKYLTMFMFTMDKKYALTPWTSKEEKLKFYATAYNTGYWKKKEEILKAGLRNDFHTSVLKPKECYNYAEIALDFYKRHK